MIQALGMSPCFRSLTRTWSRHDDVSTGGGVPQRSDVIACRSKHGADTAAAVVDALEDRWVQIEKLPQQLKRKFLDPCHRQFP